MKHIYLLMLAALMVACSSDSADEAGGQQQPVGNERVRVGLRIRAAGSGDALTRAWQDSDNATDDEMMNLWTVVVADASRNVKYIHACKPTGDTKPEVDDYVELETGTYTFYSFANMAPSVVMQLLGISGSGATGTTVTRAGNDPDNPRVGGSDDIAAKADDTVYNIAFDSGSKVTESVASVMAGVNGNGFDPTAADNGFGAKGIPMSNVQTKAVTSTTVFDLIVVRMMAKVELQLFNETASDIVIKSATLSNITKNENANLKLLPSLTQHDTMEPTHKDIQPNLGSATQGDYTYTPLTGSVTVPAGYDYDTHNANPAHTMAFYINESATPANAEGLFYLTLEVDNVGTSEYRYALISNESSEWNYIARNDYRIIPITLDDYHFQLVPYDFPPIGVYPVSVKELNTAENLYEFTFHDYGHFHLLPQVTKGSGASAVSVPYGVPVGTTDGWTLSGTTPGTFADSWFTAATKGGAWLDAAGITANGFYRSATGSTTADGDDEGRAPVWYLNDGTAGPQWDPAASANYQPFIFGYIADPGSTMPEDKKIYHEMKIRLYVGGSYRRDMIFRCYMTLSKDQMLYAPRRDATPRRPHHWAQE